MSAAKRKDIKERHRIAQEFVARVYRETFKQEMDEATLRSAASKLARAIPDAAIRKGEA